ncbi:MAG: hypothetical protein EBU90_06530 [Proteobacteria bacterium]|nr:hypothetical protein [Pseudomonadota bacterium]
MGKIENKPKIEKKGLPGYWHSFSDYVPELGYGTTLIYETEKGHEHVAFTNTETNKTTVFNISLYEKYLLLTDSVFSEQKPETD